jgi:hypothetical protein
MLRTELFLSSVLGFRLRFGYEAGGMFKILIGFILCRESLDTREPNVSNVSGMRR